MLNFTTQTKPAIYNSKYIPVIVVEGIFQTGILNSQQFDIQLLSLFIGAANCKYAEKYTKRILSLKQINIC